MVYYRIFAAVMMFLTFLAPVLFMNDLIDDSQMFILGIGAAMTLTVVTIVGIMIEINLKSADDRNQKNY